MKTIKSYIFFICLIIVNCQLSIVNSSCTKADIHYRDESGVEGYISIRPAGHDYQLPALTYHFYNTNANIEYILRPCDGFGNFEGLLPVGKYRVIATNTTAQNVEFKDMHSHELAMVSATPLLPEEGWPSGRGGGSPQSRAATGSQLASPGKVYSVAFGDLTVLHSDTARCAPEPVSLTKELIIIFIIEGDLLRNVSALSGELYGVYPSVHLYTCQPIELEPDKISNTMTRYEGIPAAGGRWKVNINLFGIYDPKHGKVYENKLGVSVDLFDGGTLQTEVDLTDILSDIIEQNLGSIPIRLPLQINLSYQEGIGLKGIVTGWLDDGDIEIGIDPK